MNNKGFIFIETIITVVILSSTLILLYNTYSNAISDEKDRLHYDDVAYIYRTNYIRNFLVEHSNLNDVKDFSFDNSYAVTIGPYLGSMFTEEQMNQNYPTSFQTLYDTFNINQIVLVKSDYISRCYQDTDPLCSASHNGLGLNLTNYLKSLNDISYQYYLVVEYAEKNVGGYFQKCYPLIDSDCKSYYVSLGI